MNLKALAERVLAGDTAVSHCPSPTHRDSGTVIPFPASQTLTDEYQERAAIMEFDGGLTRSIAEAAAYADCEIIWLKRAIQNKGTA